MAKLSAVDLDALVEQYVESAAAHRAAVDAGDHKGANRRHDVVAQTYRELRRRGREAQERLLVLLNHGDPGVRGWAAAHALEFSPSEAEPVLVELSKTAMPLGMSAAMSAAITLREWRAGRLRFP